MFPDLRVLGSSVLNNSFSFKMAPGHHLLIHTDEKWDFSSLLTSLLEESLFNQYCNGFDACEYCDLVLRLYIFIFHQRYLGQLLFFSPSPENCSQVYMLLISLTSPRLLLCFPALFWYLFTVNVDLSGKRLFCSSV